MVHRLRLLRLLRHRRRVRAVVAALLQRRRPPGLSGAGGLGGRAKCLAAPCAVEKQPEETRSEEERSRLHHHKRGKRKRRPHWPATSTSPPLDQRRTPAKLRLGNRVDQSNQDGSRVPATQRLRRRVNSRPPVHDRLGLRMSPRGRRRISPPDAEGWREVLSQSTPENSGPTPSTGNATSRRRTRKIPEEMRDKCLNCLSRTHRIATCRHLLRCLRCYSYRYFARDCKRPRTPLNGDGGNATAPNRFVRARHGSGSDDTAVGSQAGGATPNDAVDDITPAGSEAAGTTPSITPTQSVAASPVPMDRNPLPSEHPDERQWESACIIQCNAAIDGAEADLRLAITAMAADATRAVSTADAASAL